jgi:hypothetical protein
MSDFKYQRFKKKGVVISHQYNIAQHSYNIVDNLVDCCNERIRSYNLYFLTIKKLNSL